MAARGTELVDQVIAKIHADGGTLAGCGIPEHRAEGLPADALAALAMPNGAPLPPSLQRFLAYDATYLGVLERGPDGAARLAFRTFTAMVAEQFGERTADIADFGGVLPGHCLVVPGGSDSRRFLYAGEPDAHGEYPVMLVDIDDLPYVSLAYPGLDVYLADGVLADIDALDGPYADATIDQARRNLMGFTTFDLGGIESEHVDGEPAVLAFFAGLDPSGNETDD